MSEIKVDDSDPSMTLEEQLRAVQKQLQTLSQLPSAVQVTLDAISAQLASIVSTKDSSEEKEDNEENLEEHVVCIEGESRHHGGNKNTFINVKLYRKNISVV